MAQAVPVVCLCGPSAAGKTMLAAALQRRLREQQLHSLVLACDNYYRTDWDPHGRYGFDTIDAIDLTCLRQELKAVRAGTCPSLRTYDMATRCAGRQPLASQALDVILLEGAYGPQALLEDDAFAALIYVQTPLALRVARRLRRDQQQRQRSGLYVLKQTLLQTIPGERQFIRPLRQRADLIVRDPQRDLEPLMEHLARLLQAHT